MANITKTNNDTGSVVVEHGEYQDDLLTFAGADTYVEGTILARDSATLKLIAFVKGGSTNGNGVPKTVLTYEVVATGAGDIAVRAPLSGKFVKSRLVIDADGDDSNVDAAVKDELRAFNCEVVSATELNIYDN